MEFRQLNKELSKIKSSFLGRREKGFKVQADNFIIEVVYGKTGMFSSNYTLNLKYNNYVYFQMCKEPYEVWQEIQNGIKLVDMILTDPDRVKEDKIYEQLIRRSSVNEVIGKVLGRC